MTDFKPGDRVEITAKGRKVLEARGGWDLNVSNAERSIDAARTIDQIHGSGRTLQVRVLSIWWPASCWSKV